MKIQSKKTNKKNSQRGSKYKQRRTLTWRIRKYHNLESANKEKHSLGGSKKYHKLDSNLTHENLAGTFDETFIQTKQDELAQDKGRQGLFIHEVGEHR